MILSMLLLLVLVYWLVIKKNKVVLIIGFIASLIIMIKIPYILVILLIIVLTNQIYPKNVNIKKLIINYKNFIGILIIFAFINIVISNFSTQNLVANNRAKEFINEVNMEKNLDGTTVHLDQVLFDLRKISFLYSVKGKEKVVAVEIKKTLDSEKVLGDIKNLYIGKFFTKETNMCSTAVDDNNVYEKLYFVFYLTNGNNISFEVSDKKNAVDNFDIINLDQYIKSVNLNDKIKNMILYKGIEYTTITFQTNFVTNLKDFKILDNAKEIQSHGMMGSGGGVNDCTISFAPLNLDNVYLLIEKPNINVKIPLRTVEN